MPTQMISWRKFLDKIPQYYDRIINKEINVYFLEPYEPYTSEKIVVTTNDGCCTRYGFNFKVKVREFDIHDVFHKDELYTCIRLSDIIALTGIWANGSRDQSDEEPEDQRDIGILLNMICQYDIIKYKLGKQLIPFKYTEINTGYDTTNWTGTSFADVVRNLFSGNVLIKHPEDDICDD